MLDPDQSSHQRAAYLLQRFPRHPERVLALIRADSEVGEISDEYFEVCRALEDLEAEGSGGTPAANEFRRLKIDLEDELCELLDGPSSR
jgi:hypothetical protein